jgi:site-specific recombinase XerD
MKARPLTPEEIARVRAYFENSYPNRYRERDRCIFELGINCGLRVSELCALTVGQVWQYRRVVEWLELTVTKGQKPRAIPLNRTAKEAIERLIRWKAESRERLHSQDPLFRSMKGGPLTRQQVDQIWSRIREACEITGKVTTHSWRKTFASSLSTQGVPVRVIQELLGHSNLNTTQVYLSVTASQQAQAVQTLERFYEMYLSTNEEGGDEP